DLATMCSRVAGAVAEGASANRKLVLVGGNCAALPGMIGGLQQAYGAGSRIGLVWFDAHSDCNTPKTSRNGALGGMPVAVTAGFCHPAWRTGVRMEAPIPTDRIVMVDVRRMNPGEENLVWASGITTVPIFGPGLSKEIDRLASQTDVIYLHVDMDVLDASLVPSHLSRVPG